MNIDDLYTTVNSDIVCVCDMLLTFWIVQFFIWLHSSHTMWREHRIHAIIYNAGEFIINALYAIYLAIGSLTPPARAAFIYESMCERMGK